MMSCFGHYAGHFWDFHGNMINVILPREFFINKYSQEFSTLDFFNRASI